MDFVRDIDAAFLAEISKPYFYPVALVRLDWPGEVVEAHTGAGNIAFDGGVFTGTLSNNENLGQITIPGEETRNRNSLDALRALRRSSRPNE